VLCKAVEQALLSMRRLVAFVLLYDVATEHVIKVAGIAGAATMVFTQPALLPHTQRRMSYCLLAA
jgi:hypothetical protein